MRKNFEESKPGDCCETMRSSLHVDKRRCVELAVNSLLILLLIVTLAPIIYLTFFDYANGDDFGFSSGVRRIIMTHGGAKAFVDTLLNELSGVYYSWQGTWSSVLLFQLQPGIFGEHWYTLTGCDPVPLPLSQRRRASHLRDGSVSGEPYRTSETEMGADQSQLSISSDPGCRRDHAKSDILGFIHKYSRISSG